MTSIFYADEYLDLIVESINLNGKSGAVNVTDSEEDLDLTFEDKETALAWAKKLVKLIKAHKDDDEMAR